MRALESRRHHGKIGKSLLPSLRAILGHLAKTQIPPDSGSFQLLFGKHLGIEVFEGIKSIIRGCAKFGQA